MKRIWLGLIAFVMAFGMASAANAVDTYTQTKYPIVLVHGLFGFDKIAGIEYWYRIPQELARSGAKVYVVSVPAANSTEIRGEALLTQVKQILAATGAAKVNLVGHSHGGPTIRYVAAVRPDLVASATSVGGVNWGAEVADAVSGVTTAVPLSATVIAAAGNALASVINFLNGTTYNQDILAALAALTTPNSVAFNAKYPAGMPTVYCGAGTEVGGNGVRYYSWGGAKQLTNLFDPSDLLLKATSLVYPTKNDGLVSSCSNHLGKVLRDNYSMNHLDEVNQLLGMTDIWSTSPTTVYRDQANRLRNLGL